MLCPHCSRPLHEGARFCGACGKAVESDLPKADSSQPASSVTAAPVQTPATPQKKKKTGLIIAIIAIALVALLLIFGLIVLAVTLFFSNYDAEWSFPWGKSAVVSENHAETIVQQPELAEEIDALISSYQLSGDVTVAVVDHKTGEEFLSNSSSNSFTSWGFYLPVYMAFSDAYPSSYATYKTDILSADPARCNVAANFAINSFGGPAGITNYMRDNLQYSSTTFGRNFGDVNATGDNYTTAEEAARILSQFNEQYHYAELCYNPSSYGIVVPAGASMYAQFGSENINVKQNLNVFAIVKGSNSDYSIAILTQNRASATGIVNDVLNTVHSYMEENS